jgi:osmotically inducible protein OsmC
MIKCKDRAIPFLARFLNVIKGRNTFPRRFFMPIRHAEAEWKGSLKKGSGTVSIKSIAFERAYSFSSRFEQGKGTNPEELLGAAHAGCFSMALSGILEGAGFISDRISTKANVTIELVGKDFKITGIQLVCRAKVPGIDQAQFKIHAEAAKKGCPISGALTGVTITLDASLE